jgi:hypothetical protein
VKLKTDSTRVAKKLKGVNEWMRKNMMLSVEKIVKRLNMSLIGYFNYYYVTFNAHLILDQNQYGDFLSDYSGIRDSDDLQISFGRETKSEIDAALPTTHLSYALRDKTYLIYNDNIFRLDYGILSEDCTELFDPGFVHEH